MKAFDLPWMHGEWRPVMPTGEVIYGGRRYDLSNVTDLLDLQVVVGGAWEAVGDDEHPSVTAARAREADALARLQAAEIALAVTEIQGDSTRAERLRPDIDRFHQEYATGVVKPEGETTRIPLTSIRDESGEVTALTAHDLATPSPTPDNRADLIREHRRRTGL